MPQTSPSYSCISKKAKTIEINYRAPNHISAAHVEVDSTGL
ncbi:transposase [Shewanella sp. VB17]|nr:transposase [Shewanella sp. VB17]